MHFVRPVHLMDRKNQQSLALDQPILSLQRRRQQQAMIQNLIQNMPRDRPNTITHKNQPTATVYHRLDVFQFRCSGRRFHSDKNQGTSSDDLILSVSVCVDGVLVLIV